MTTGSTNLIADPDYVRLKEHLIRSTGLAYYEDKDDNLAARIGQRLATLDLPDCASYLDLLRDPNQGESELEAVAAELTIGETYFFRHTEQFDALRDIVLPDILERNRTTRRLRIWSAGCATGAEPYSVALLLRHDLAERIAGWDVTILGTDMNRCFLARAREGRFEEWAFRATPNHVWARCFEPEGRSWLIRPEYKEWVSFQYHNLATHPFPSLVNNLSAFDLILCRNVMIYFSAGAIQRRLEQFWECLVEGGWLLVGHAESNTEFFQAFRTINAPGTTLYQRAAPPPAAPPALPGPAIPIPATEWPPRQPERPERPEADGLATVRVLADRGEWQEAVACCRGLLEMDGLNAAVHFYHALVLEQAGLPKEAEVSLRRALYLDRSFVLAHYHLGLFLQKGRNVPQARRSFENVIELLSRTADEGALAGPDGMTVADLRELTTMHLEVLRRET
jgi:chemotaxis protein methyltransferase CheR